MHIQNSYKDNKNTLFIIPSPIGNLEDITLRTLSTLNQLNILYCEDTRVTIKLLNHFEIKINKLDSYHEYNKEDKLESIKNDLLTQDVGIITDAGMPGISDPGYHIINEIYKESNVVILPGAVAFTLPLVYSNLIDKSFTYHGFLSKQKSQRQKELELILSKDIPTIIYLSKHKFISTLELILTLNPNTQLTVGRELTKLHEQYIQGSVKEVLDYYKDNVIKGEFVLVIKPIQIKEDIKPIDYFINLTKEGYDKKEAIKLTAKEYNVPKNDIYQLILRGGR
ncbi:MAG: 16S rRNA (cytidine(1402)-2'-O)-methyltransferase [Mycoplasmatales bacterium]